MNATTEQKHTNEWIVFIGYLDNTPKKAAIYDDGDGLFHFFERFVAGTDETFSRIETYFADTPHQLAQAIAKIPESLQRKPVLY